MIIAATSSINGSAYQRILLKFAVYEGCGQPVSVNPKWTPRPSFHSKLQNRPALRYSTEEAKMFGSQVNG